MIFPPMMCGIRRFWRAASRGAKQGRNWYEITGETLERLGGAEQEDVLVPDGLDGARLAATKANRTCSRLRMRFWENTA